MIGRLKLAVIGTALVVLAGAGWVSLRAQGLGPSSAGSLAELTAEVRQLRVVVQEAGRSQTQMQALSISLTAQQSRLSQVSARLDASHEDLRKASEATRTLQRTLASVQEDVNSSTMSAAERADFAERLKEFKASIDRALEEENAVRVRQAELMTQFRTEELRWLELVAKLDEVIKR